MKSFLKVPQKVHHALILVAELAPTFENGVPIALEKIAAKQHISQGFLEEIAGCLRTANIVNGRRGAKGGYIIAKDPKTISVADVVSAIDGPLALVDCLGTHGACTLSSQCTTKNVWHRLQNQMTATLSSLTIAELV